MGMEISVIQEGKATVVAVKEQTRLNVTGASEGYFTVHVGASSSPPIDFNATGGTVVLEFQGLYSPSTFTPTGGPLNTDTLDLECDTAKALTDATLGANETDGTVVVQIIQQGVNAVTAQNEIQGIEFANVGGGTYQLVWEHGTRETTSGLAWDATAASVQAALEALTNIPDGRVQVSGAHDTGFTVEFVSDFANLPMEDLEYVSYLNSGGFRAVIVVVS